MRKLWVKIQNIESTIRSFIKSVQSQEKYEDCIQFTGHDLINEHYVIPIRSDRYKKDHGNIISKSTQGSTLYVEPFEIRDMASDRIQMLAIIYLELT